MKQEQTQVATKDSSVVKATKVEITAIKDGKKPNRLVGFFKGVRDKLVSPKNSIKGVFANEKSISQAKTPNPALKRLEIDGSDPLADKTIFLLFIAILEELLNKKIATDEMIDELRKNETLTREFNATAIQSALSKNANLSKELITASLEKAINESQNLTQEQKDFYLSKLNDKDFMDKFYDILSIKDKEDIANKAKSSNELLALVNESFGNNFAKAKEKISKSQIDSNTMNSLDDTAMNDIKDTSEARQAVTKALKENEDLSNSVNKARKQGEK